MNIRLSTLAAAIAVALSTYSTALAADVIHVHGRKDSLRGQITEISPTEVKIDKSPLVETIPVNEISRISFNREPEELMKGRDQALKGQYIDALETLKTVDTNEFAGAQNKRVIQQDLDYYNAYCTTKLALGGRGTVKAAGDLMQPFYANNKDSYHYLEATELMGDLLVAFGTEAARSIDKDRQAAAPRMFAKAMDFYTEAGKAPWPEAAVGLSLKRGHALLAQKRTDEAAQAFQTVLDGATGPKADSQKLSAMLGKAMALAMNKRGDEAIKLVEGVISKSPKTNVEVLGQAWLTLGHCHRAANNPREAVMDYLHVDLLYDQNPQVHAEALASLVQVWQSLNRPDRANEFSTKLTKKYPNSSWAK